MELERLFDDAEHAAASHAGSENLLDVPAQALYDDDLDLQVNSTASR